MSIEQFLGKNARTNIKREIIKSKIDTFNTYLTVKVIQSYNTINVRNWDITINNTSNKINYIQNVAS